MSFPDNAVLHYYLSDNFEEVPDNVTL